MTKPTGKPVGRPSKYTEELADLICERMINGEHIVQICQDEEMPSRPTVYKWMAEKPEFHTRIARAREGLADHVAWQILDMASKSTSETANADRVKLAAWQWHAARLSPKKYSEKVITELSGPDGAPVQVETKTIDSRALTPEQRQALRSVLMAAKESAQ
jgi:hypothetical protein